MDFYFYWITCHTYRDGWNIKQNNLIILIKWIMDLSSCNKNKYPKIYQQLATSIRDYPQIELSNN